MSIRDYYHGEFRTDVANVVGQGAAFGGDERHYFGHTWKSDCQGLDCVPTPRQAEFLLCLYFTVLVDQAMHAHYREHYEAFRQLTLYPKFCFGLGQVHFSPYGILEAPIAQGKVAAAAVEALLGDAMAVFVEEVVSFCRAHMPQIDPGDFFAGLLGDPDMAPGSNSGAIRWKVYAALAAATKAVRPAPLAARGERNQGGAAGDRRMVVGRRGQDVSGRLGITGGDMTGTNRNKEDGHDVG